MQRIDSPERRSVLEGSRLDADEEIRAAEPKQSRNMIRLRREKVSEFVREDDLQNFEVWLKEIQGFDPTTLSAEDLAEWRFVHTEVMERSAATPKVGLMKLQPRLGQSLYGVAIRDCAKLWLTLWVRRGRQGDIYVMIPRGDRSWDPHTSYHRDGNFHSKSFGKKLGQSVKRQPLDESFKGTEHIGIFVGHGKSIGAICNPDDFTGVVEVESGILGPRNGWVAVDLIQQNCEPMDLSFTGRVLKQAIFTDPTPSLVIRIGSHGPTRIDADS
jgi:hypothetical protein